MTDESKSNNQSLDQDLEKRLRDSREKFDQNYLEFKSKSIKDAPCFRSTFLTSIPAGLFTGLASYLVTSKAKFSANLAMGAYLVVTAGYFTKCRIDFNKKIEQNKELGEIMNLIIKYRGTDLEPQLQRKYSEKLQEMDPKSRFV